MPEMTKTELEQVLKNIIEGLAKVSGNPDDDYYVDLYPTHIDENGYEEPVLDEADLAEAAIEYPELHPLMVEMVEQIIRVTNRWELWWYEDEQAGSLMSLALALHDKKYCQLFADCLANQDLDHAVNQNAYILEIDEKWGLCEETAAILLARYRNEGQDGPEFIAGFAHAYGDELKKYFGDEWDEEWVWEEEEPKEKYDANAQGDGYAMTLQNKRALKSIVIFWDEGYNCIVLLHQKQDITKKVCNALDIYEYASYEEVAQVMAELEPLCDGQTYGVLKQKRKAIAKFVAGDNWTSSPRDAVDLLRYVEPTDFPSAQEYIVERIFKGTAAKAKTIPCKKVQLYKGIYEFAVLMADPAGCRIRSAFEFEGQNLWSYASEEEMNEGLQALVQEYTAKGYEVVLEEDVDYAFDHCLTMSEEDIALLLEITGAVPVRQGPYGGEPISLA